MGVYTGRSSPRLVGGIVAAIVSSSQRQSPRVYALLHGVYRYCKLYRYRKYYNYLSKYQTSKIDLLVMPVFKFLGDLFSVHCVLCFYCLLVFLLYGIAHLTTIKQTYIAYASMHDLTDRQVLCMFAVITCPALNVSSIHPALRVKDNKLDGYRPRELARFRCIPGYRLDRTSRRTVRCKDGGRWDSEPPSCYRVFCHHPPRINHASVVDQVDRIAAGGHLVYRCDDGYRLGSADDRLKCNNDGNWVRLSLIHI